MPTFHRARTASVPLRAAMLVASLAVAACGGATATAGPGGPGATSGSPTAAPGASTAATQDPGPGASVDGCTLLTEADILEASGNPVTSSESGPQDGIFPAGCVWELADEDALVPPSVHLGVMATGGRAYWDRYFAPYVEDREPIDGLGDDAMEDIPGSVLVVAGDTLLALSYFGLTDEDTAIATDLAQKVVANLGR